MNQSLFDNSILIKLIEVSEIGNRAYCKIAIEIGDEKLKVMDVIDFSNDCKIIRIEAFKGWKL